VKTKWETNSSSDKIPEKKRGSQSTVQIIFDQDIPGPVFTSFSKDELQQQCLGDKATPVLSVCQAPLCNGRVQMEKHITLA